MQITKIDPVPFDPIDCFLRKYIIEVVRFFDVEMTSFLGSNEVRISVYEIHIVLVK